MPNSMEFQKLISTHMIFFRASVSIIIIVVSPSHPSIFLLKMDGKSRPAAAKSDGSEDLYQIALLIDQLKHDDVQLRINASKSLFRIANALGPERTREELIPFLSQSSDDEDEVLFTIAEKLGELVSCVGGEEFAFCLLEPLELLSTVEESTVRDAAIKTIDAIVSVLPEDHLGRYYAPFVVRLASKDWFTSRISAASLFHVGYSKLVEQDKKSFQSNFLRLCSDDTPMVRRVAAQKLGQLAGQLRPAELNDFVTAFETLARDDQDSVRIQAIYTSIALAQALPSDARMHQVLPVILGAAADRAWRVRWALANHMHEISGALGTHATDGQMSTVMENLLNDSESEVSVHPPSSVVLRFPCNAHKKCNALHCNAIQ